MTFPVKHLSASSIQTFISCPAAWYARYVLKLPETTPPRLMAAAGQGRAVHASLSAYHRGADPEHELVRRWSTEVPESVQHLVSLSTALTLVRAYVAGVTVRQADRADVRFTLEVPGVPIPLIGFIDILSGSHIRELKSTSSQKSWQPDDVHHTIQGGVYWAAALDSGIKRPKMTYSILRVGGDPVHTEIETSRSRADLQQLGWTIRGVYQDMVQAVESGGETVRSGCRPNWCRYPVECSARFGYQRPERKSPVASMKSSLVVV